MSFSIRKEILIFLFLCFGLITKGQVSFTATSDAKQVVTGNVVDVSFVLSNAKGSNFEAPDFKYFQVLSGPNQSSSTTVINGNMSSEMSLNYTLMTKKTGTFTVGSAKIKVKGKELKTKPFKIEVVKGKPQDVNGSMGDLSKKVYIKTIPSTTDGITGQEILIDYKLYTTVDVDNFNILTESEYSGCYAQNLHRYRTKVLKEVIDGVQYSTKILKRVALYPQQGGTIEISPMNMELGLRVNDPNNPQRRRSLFYRPKTKRHVVNTEAVKINVRPLPKGAPESFSGAVGVYKMSSRVDKRVMSTDDALTLVMNISGSGDIKRVQPPDLGLGENFEVYEPKILEEETYENQGGFTGKKVIEYLILPKKPGRFSLKPQFSYYDTDSSGYVTLYSRGHNVSVSQGTKKKQTDIIAGSSKLNQEMRGIITETSLKKSSWMFFGSPIFYLLGLAPFLFLSAVVVKKRKQDALDNVDDVTKKKQRARKLAEQRLGEAEKLLKQGNSKLFYNEISTAMFGYVSDRLNIPYSEISKANVQEKMASNGISKGHIDQFMSIVKTCEMALFAGKDNASAMHETYNGALDVIVNMIEE